MKTTIHYLTTDRHDAGSDVELFATQAAIDARKKAIIEERLNDIGDVAAYYRCRPGEAQALAADEVRELLKRGDAADAWSIFYDHLCHSEDYFTFGEADLDVALSIAALVPEGDLDRAHDRVSALIEDPYSSTEELRDAVVGLCEALNVLHEQRAATAIDGNHEDYQFTEGPAPSCAKSFGFDGSGQVKARIACIAYSGTICNPVRGIDIHGNYWCASLDDIVKAQAK